MKIEARIERFRLARPFKIARGSRTQTTVLVVEVVDGPHIGRGEGLPYAHYGETAESVMSEIDAVRGDIDGGVDRQGLRNLMRPGAARNALDAALWDLEARQSGVPIADRLGLAPCKALKTMLTVSLDTPSAMAEAAHTIKDMPILKVKLGQGLIDIDRIRAVRGAAPDASIVVDANEGWQAEDLPNLFSGMAAAGVAMVEQPLPAETDQALAHIERPIPVYADESVRGEPEWSFLQDPYDGINIKVAKSGGLTAALEHLQKARGLDFGIMVGCMVATSLSIAPAHILAQNADYVDLDAPFLLADDRKYAMTVKNGWISPPDPRLWGG